MKNVQIMFSVAVVLQILLLSACGSDEPVAAEVTTKALTADTWKMQNVSVDGTDQTNVYSGLAINFTSIGFTTINGGPVWPASGTWSFTDGTAKTIKRSDGLEISINEVSATKLVLKLIWNKTTIGPGRVASVGGEHTFTSGH